MSLILEQRMRVFDLNWELYRVNGDTVKEYSKIIKGYLLHLTLSDRSLKHNDVLSINHYWKTEIKGSFENLIEKLESLKKELSNIKSEVFEDIDQFCYVHLFIVEQNNEYKLIVASDTYDVSKLINLD